jgi:hypothetical protein
VAATGGLLFGFDTGVISGALRFLRDRWQLGSGQIEALTNQFSDAAYDRPAKVVLLIAERLGAKKLTIDGRFIVVKGKHACYRYRVHVGSATAFLDSGASLALRPATTVATDPSLPFAEDDVAMAEAINKVVFLANDAAATDPSFLKQIGVSGKR